MPASPKSDAQKSTFAIKAAVALIILLFGLFVVTLSYSLMREYREAQKRAEDRAFAASQVVSTNGRWISELSRQALARIDEALGVDVESNVAATSELIRQAVSDLPGNVKAYVVAADGHTVFSTDPNVKPIDVRDRPYFSTLAQGASWYTSPLLVSRLDGQQIFVFSKRLEREGRFVGAAVISFDVVMLREIWESLNFDQFSTVSLIRTDGQLVARYPLAEGPLDLSNYVLFTDHLPRNDVGVYPAESPADGVTRIVSYRRIPGSDLVALASVSTGSALAVFKRNAFMTLFFAVPTALALAGAIAWIISLLRANEQRSGQLAQALQLNQMLVRDTHHRVKNNLQAIMSMVRMHPLPGELKDALQHRIAAMSAVHEHLYRLDQFVEVDASTLIPGIIEPLREASPVPAVINYDVEPIVLDRDNATPLALLVSEVITNSLKYAMNGHGAPRIDISLKKLNDGNIELVIQDNGPGFDASIPSTGLGRRLIRAMVVQLGGKSDYTFDNGARFHLEIPSNAL